MSATEQGLNLVTRPERNDGTQAERERLIMIKAADDHVIEEFDSINQPCWTPRGVVMAPNLACNEPGVVGKLAGEFNAAGRQVWTAQLMIVRRDKIIRRAA